MLEDMKVSPDPKQIGYYAGVIESRFNQFILWLILLHLCNAVFETAVIVFYL